VDRDRERCSHSTGAPLWALLPGQPVGHTPQTADDTFPKVPVAALGGSQRTGQWGQNVGWGLLPLNVSFPEPEETAIEGGPVGNKVPETLLLTQAPTLPPPTSRHILGSLLVLKLRLESYLKMGRGWWGGWLYPRDLEPWVRSRALTPRRVKSAASYQGHMGHKTIIAP
jgi:hypothetical protein